MAVLLLRFAAPLQAWGSDSKFEVRRTELFPTKSGVIGFIASALGRSREDELSDLKDLKIGVRVDDPGTMISDFHTAKSQKSNYITTRYYLSDAVFLVGIESDNVEKLEEIGNAIQHPVYPLFLGRRSCPPTLPIVLEIENNSLFNALKGYRWLVSEKRSKRVSPNSRCIVDADSPLAGRMIKDNPLSYSPKNRKFGVRFIEEIPITFDLCGTSAEPEHDAFGTVEG